MRTDRAGAARPSKDARLVEDTMDAWSIPQNKLFDESDPYAHVDAQAIGCKQYSLTILVQLGSGIRAVCTNWSDPGGPDRSARSG